MSFEILPESLWQTLRWIHVDLPNAEFDALLADVEPRLRIQTCLPPLELVEGHRRVAAAYFVKLHGSVATLGGMRSMQGYEARASRLLAEFTVKLEQQRIQQVQALVDVANHQSTQILQCSSYQQVTTVKHLWLDTAHYADHHRSPIDHCASMLNWRAACSVSMSTFGDLLEATFQETLDCPALNGLRSGGEVLQSFLGDQTWDGQLPWKILCDGSRPIGCSLRNRHPRNINELVYIGVLATHRGQKLGQKLVQGAVEDCRQAGAGILVTAVDAQNWPARTIYRNLGFNEHLELAVWLPTRLPATACVAA